MRLSRIFMALTVGLAVAAVPTAAGAAQPQPPVYPPTTPSLTVTPPTIRLGGTFTLRGEGFAAGAVAISVAISGNPNAAPAQATVVRSMFTHGSRLAIMRSEVDAVSCSFSTADPAPQVSATRAISLRAARSLAMVTNRSASAVSPKAIWSNAIRGLSPAASQARK